MSDAARGSDRRGGRRWSLNPQLRWLAENSHSTGHESRLNRTFGDELYSKEELVAEMGAAFLCVIAGIGNEHTDRNTTAYIQNWISQLEDDNRLIVHAAANAQKAVDAILGTSFESEGEPEMAVSSSFSAIEANPVTQSQAA